MQLNRQTQNKDRKYINNDNKERKQGIIERQKQINKWNHLKIKGKGKERKQERKQIKKESKSIIRIETYIYI